MKKRLRKKRHVGEFREYAFRLDIKLNVGCPSPEFEKFVDDFILDKGCHAAEALGKLANKSLKHRMLEQPISSISTP